MVLWVMEPAMYGALPVCDGSYSHPPTQVGSLDEYVLACNRAPAALSNGTSLAERLFQGALVVKKCLALLLLNFLWHWCSSL